MQLKRPATLWLATLLGPVLLGPVLLSLAVPAHAQPAGAGPPIIAPPLPPTRESSERRSSPPGYPPLALMEGREGTTYVRLTTNAAGKINSCAVSRSSGHADLDAAACNVAVRVRIPAEYIDGTPRRFNQPVRWKLETPPEAPPKPAQP